MDTLLLNEVIILSNENGCSFITFITLYESINMNNEDLVTPCVIY